MQARPQPKRLREKKRAAEQVSNCCNDAKEKRWQSRAPSNATNYDTTDRTMSCTSSSGNYASIKHDESQAITGQSANSTTKQQTVVRRKDLQHTEHTHKFKQAGVTRCAPATNYPTEKTPKPTHTRIPSGKSVSVEI